MTSEGEVTNNAGYVFVSLMPLFLFWDKRKIIQYFMLAVCSFFVISSMKRGAIFTGAVCVLLFILSSFDKRLGHKQILILVLTIIFFYWGYKFILNLMENNAFFMSRVDATVEGYSSGRDILYKHYWEMFINEKNLIFILVGHGADATIRSGYNYAHNDWLEILINQGLLGVTLFVIFWCRFYQMWKKSSKGILKVALCLCLITLFLKTFFSMSINDMSIYSTLLIGVGAAAYKNNDVLIRLTT